MMNVKEELIRFIHEELLNGQRFIGEDEDLLMDGTIDSVGMMRLVSYLEESHQMSVPPEDFTIENFSTASLIFLRRRTPAVSMRV